MKIALISDLHLFYKSKVSDFELTDDELYKELTLLHSKYDMVVICGDLVEMWQFPWFGHNSINKGMAKIKAMFPKSLEFTRKNLVLLRGNHDYYLNQYLEILTRDYILGEKDTIYISHGIEDFFNKRMKRLSKFGGWLGGWAERVLGSKIENTIERILRVSFGINLFRNKAQIRKFKSMIDSNNALVMYIAGHTHKQQVITFEYKHKLRTYINTGSFQNLNGNVTVIDSELKSVQQQKSMGRILSYRDFIKNLRVGDIVLSGNTVSPFSGIIKELTNSRYSHSMFYLGNGEIIESTYGGGNDGVIKASISKYMEGEHDLCILRPADTYRTKEVIANLYSKLGIEYSIGQLFLDAFYFLLNRIFNKEFRRDGADYSNDAVVCSELIIGALEDIYGWEVNAATYTPQDFLDDTIRFKQVYSLKV